MKSSKLQPYTSTVRHIYMYPVCSPPAVRSSFCHHVFDPSTSPTSPPPPLPPSPSRGAADGDQGGAARAGSAWRFQTFHRLCTADLHDGGQAGSSGHCTSPRECPPRTAAHAPKGDTKEAKLVTKTGTRRARPRAESGRGPGRHPAPGWGQCPLCDATDPDGCPHTPCENAPSSSRGRRGPLTGLGPGAGRGGPRAADPLERVGPPPTQGRT